MTSAVARAWKAAVTLLAATGSPDTRPHLPTTVNSIQSEPSTPPLNAAIEVLAPSYGNVRGDPCVVALGTHEFGYSYGTPFVANFPPATCDDLHSILYLKWFATSPLGVQFDRIAAVWVNGVELLRTSTQEPDRRAGVKWEIAKDVSNYYDVVKRGGDVVVALDNVIDGPYNSSFTVTLSAEFYQPLDDSAPRHRPDAVVPISRSNSTYGWFTVEPSSSARGDNSALVSVPANTEELYLELFLSHHQCDEFWYGNPPTEYASQVGACGNGPFREVQVLVDDELVGVVWPFPLLFTGGLNPYLWRPIVAIGAFQVPTYMLNLTPFLSKFVDAKPHNVTFFVDYGIDFWPIDGNLLVYVDAKGTQTRAQVLEKRFDAHVVPAATQQIDGLDANFTLTASRSVYVKSSVTTSKGTKIYELTQQFEYANAQEYLQEGEIGTFDSRTRVSSTLSVTAPSVQQGGQQGRKRVTVATEEEYPLAGRTYYKQFPDSTFRLEAQLSNAFRRALRVEPASATASVFRLGLEPKDVRIALQGKAEMQSGIGGNGTTSATYQERSPAGVCFSRAAAADRGVLLRDESSTTC